MTGVPTPSLQQTLTKWDQLVTDWNLDAGERSALLGGFSPGRVDDVDTYEPEYAERRMRLCVELADSIDRVAVHPDRVRSWLRRRNSGLGGLTPIQAMASSSEWTRWLTQHLGEGM